MAERPGDDDRRAGRELPRPVYRLAWRFLLRCPARGSDPRLAIRDPAIDAANAVRETARLPGSFASVRSPFGMLAVAVFFMGQFALFTYLRPFLETVARVDVSTLSVILLILGGAGLLGTY